MASVFERLLGVPFTHARRREEIESHLRFRNPADMRATMSENLSHITQKSGALLAAQAIFIVVDTYGIDHGWPRTAMLVSILTQILAALLVMLNLRTVYMETCCKDPARTRKTRSVQIASLAGVRGARPTSALYLTFLSVILMGFGALRREHCHNERTRRNQFQRGAVGLITLNRPKALNGAHP